MKINAYSTAYVLTLAASLIIAGSGCGGGGSGEELTVEERYQAALQDAQIAEPGEVRDNLTAIIETNKDLVWQSTPSGSRVLMSTWTSWNGYAAYQGQEMTVTREIWVDPIPEVQQFCLDAGLSGAELVLRLEQLIGLPPNNGNTIFVEMWVSPADMFRPTPDPEINDTTAELDFPPGVSDEHRAWIDNLKAVSYNADGYPWTRLGYTYDWHGGDEQGLSEFVVRSGATVGIASVQDTFTYCGSRSE